MKTEEFDFELPKELIALYPCKRRVESRLFLVRRDPFAMRHLRFYHILRLLDPGDLLVLNKTRVIKARLFGKRSTGGKIEVLVTSVLEGRTFLGLVRTGKKIPKGEILTFKEGGKVEFEGVTEKGERIFKVLSDEEPLQLIEREGTPPIPPYIKRKAESLDERRYQTVYAEVPGSIAAPTAGLHFSRKLLEELKAKGIRIAYIILHVGVGTFRPIRTENIRQHRMEEEYFIVPGETKRMVEEVILSGKRVVAVGTSVTRALETWSLGMGKDHGATGLFIYPPYRFKVIDGLVTNFHLPRSTNLVLVASLLGKERLRLVYGEAIERRYRFYTYGDAMLIL